MINTSAHPYRLNFLVVAYYYAFVILGSLYENRQQFIAAVKLLPLWLSIGCNVELLGHVCLSFLSLLEY
jgi:hypothetical protein